MSNKNQLTNVVGAYSVSMSGGVNALSYADIMNANSPYKVSDSAKAHLLAIKEGNAEQTGATFKIGYHLAELTKGENPEYKKMGYSSIKALAVNMFDMNEVTAYAWADTAARFVEYDANTGKYHSIFATEENGKLYDFSMSQLQEMRFPIDKKTGKETVSLDVWRVVCPALINVKTTTKDIRMVKGCIAALAKAKAEITVESVSDLWVKAERLSMSPDKALPYNEEQAQPTQAQPTQAQPAQAQPAQVQPTQAQPTQAQPTQAQPTQAQPTQAEDKVTSRCTITVDGMVITPGYIATAIQSGVLNTTIKAVLEPFAQYALLSEVCRNALGESIDCITDFIEQNMEQAEPEQAEPEQAQPEQAQPEQAQPEQAQPEQAQPEQAQPEQAQPETPIANNSKGKGKGKKAKG